MMNGLRSTAFAIVMFTALAGDVGAQTAERPVWPRRNLAVSNIMFPGEWTPGIYVGVVMQPGLHRTRVSTDEFGATVVTGVQWYAHVLVSGGRAPYDRGDFSGLAQLGIVHLLRNDGPLGINRLGLVAQGTYEPNGIGPVGRIEFFHGNAALSVGWMDFEEPRGNAFVVNVEVLRCILQDLGLVSTCVTGTR